jgi:hypothetical protein
VTVTSLTNNLDWGEDDLGNILTKLVYEFGKRHPDELLLQASASEQVKSDNT